MEDLVEDDDLDERESERDSNEASPKVQSKAFRLVSDHEV